MLVLKGDVTIYGVSVLWWRKGAISGGHALFVRQFAVSGIKPLTDEDAIMRVVVELEAAWNADKLDARTDYEGPFPTVTWTVVGPSTAEEIKKHLEERK
jgi:hypothetical protein